MSTGGHVFPGETRLWRHLRIEWNDVATEIRAAAEPHVLAALFALPSWVTELNLFWSETGETECGEAALSVTVRDEYRLLSVFIHPGFLAFDAEGRYRTIMHEFSHALVHPVVAFAESLIEQLPEAAQGIAKEQLRRANESATQDATEALLRAHGYAGES